MSNGYGIQLDDYSSSIFSINNTIENNSLYNTSIGIYLYQNSTNNNIRNNIINYTSSLNQGIYLFGSNYNTIYNNIVHNIGWNGIAVRSSYNNISNNDLKYIRHNGIDLWVGDDTPHNYNIINNNLISDLLGDIIYLYTHALFVKNGTGNNFTNNIIYNSGEGLTAYLTSNSFNNYFYNNSIYNSPYPIVNSYANNSYINNSIYNLSSALRFDNISAAILNGNMNITNLDVTYFFILNNFNVTEGVLRAYNPINLSGTSTLKVINSTLTESINASIILDATCDSINPVEGDVYSLTYGSKLYYWNQLSCSNNQINLTETIPSGVTQISITYMSASVASCTSVGDKLGDISDYIGLIILAIILISVYPIMTGKESSLNLNYDYRAIWLLGMVIIFIVIVIIALSKMCI